MWFTDIIQYLYTRNTYIFEKIFYSSALCTILNELESYIQSKVHGVGKSFTSEYKNTSIQVLLYIHIYIFYMYANPCIHQIKSLWKTVY